ncbi:hypothetical protein BDV28DRAFT_83374 [Aspergillus coremiiformis]|uniref:Uncharacterized protein n=1 Tax=Aspergillus coremiiformis TaxID=138285 RepID=A0A5N6ZGF5_9EURO|nr:hypothetical protein BDV28DRAFT_83374 [Aspergillus coremiiformis]
MVHTRSLSILPAGFTKGPLHQSLTSFAWPLKEAAFLHYWCGGLRGDRLGPYGARRSCNGF